MSTKTPTVSQYLAKLPADRRKAIEAVRQVIRKNIDKTFEEGIQYRAIGYYVPHSVFPAGYHCDAKEPLPFAGIANQKNHIGLYLFCVYMNPELEAWFRSEWKKSGKKLDMGKSCVRVKKLEDIPLDVVGKLFKKIKAKDFIAGYEASLSGHRSKKAAKKKPAKKTAKKAPKKAATKKVTKKKVLAKKRPAKKVRKKVVKKSASRRA